MTPSLRSALVLGHAILIAAGLSTLVVLAARGVPIGAMLAAAAAILAASTIGLALWMRRQSRRQQTLEQAVQRTADELQGRLDALARERDEREQILSRMSDGVAVVAADGRAAHLNPGMAELLGISPPVSGARIQDFARSPDLDELIESARRAGEPVERELRVRGPRPRLVRATASRLGEQGGTVLLILHDLAEAERVMRLRQDFVANVSHELKTPLTSVRGYAETLLEGGLDDLEHRDGFVRVIRDQATRLQAMVEDLLSLAELEQPDAKLRLEEFDLRDLVQRQVADLESRADRAGLALALAPGGPEPVQADRGRIGQVIANLLDNALKYTERGQVEVSLGGDDATVSCEVRDTGPGIPEEEQPRIFERFYRVDKARAREKGGTGLGLSIVKHILALHGGDISLRSRPGEGSSFRFSIPRAAVTGR